MTKIKKTPTAKKAAPAKKTTAPTAKKSNVVTEEDIRKRAQKIFEERMKKGILGTAEKDWIQAEKELNKK